MHGMWTQEFPKITIVGGRSDIEFVFEAILYPDVEIRHGARKVEQTVAGVLSAYLIGR